MREAVKIELNDDEGNPHSYVITQRGASEGFDLFGRLSRIVGPGIGRGVGNTKIKGIEDMMAGSATAEDADVDVDVVLDIGALGDGFGAVASAIMAEGGHKFVQEILRHTMRDGQPLSNKATFDSAFQANYGELGEAVARVLHAEFGGMLTRLPFVRKALATLAPTK